MASLVSTTLMLLISSSMIFNCSATDHQIDWLFGVDYSGWASNKIFIVGDNLVFNYTAGSYTVAEVENGGYITCEPRVFVSLPDSSGLTVIPLKTAGTHFFMCTKLEHCQSGMKLAVTASPRFGGFNIGGTNSNSNSKSGNVNDSAPPSKPTSSSSYSHSTALSPRDHCFGAFMYVFLAYLNM